MSPHRGVQGIDRCLQATHSSPPVRAAHRTNIDGVWIRPNVARQLAVGATVRFGASTREYKARSALSGLLPLVLHASCFSLSRSGDGNNEVFAGQTRPRMCRAAGAPGAAKPEKLAAPRDCMIARIAVRYSEMPCSLHVLHAYVQCASVARCIF
jgi:hypothetical protein